MPTRKLIEVALPLDDINAASAREKSIRHGHPSTLHLWWARRPLAACRAVLFASLIDDPDQEGVPAELLAEIDALPAPELPDWQELPLAEQRRQRLFRFIKLLVQWESSNDERVLATARRLIHAATGGNPPPVYDPFAGGGSIPLEAQRLGLEAHASDLNPVAVLINKALIEIPPRFANQPPVNPVDNPGARASRTHPGWRSRGYLPHFDQPGLIQSITFRLADAMPSERRAEWAALLESGDEVQRRKQFERYIDAGYGSCALRDERVAAMVQQALLHFDGERYRLLAWAIMPNHVHVLVETFPEHTLADVLHSWKSYTAKEANKLLGRSGEFWQQEYFDRYIRDEKHLADAVRYIHQNPVKAGLVNQAEDWQWSSARSEAAGTAALPGVAWKGAAGLAADVRYYGKWMRDEAEKRIGHLYPKVQLPKEHGGGEATVIAWLWARTVTCPNPACGATMPLVRSFALSTKKSKEAWVEPAIEPGAPPRVRFEVRSGAGKPPEGTVGRKGARCICCQSPVSLDHIRAEGRAGRMGAQMMAIVAEGKRGRIYLPPSEEHERVAASAEPAWVPETELPEQALGFRVQNYGLTRHADLFTSRQLVALTTFSDLVGEARERVRRDAEAADVGPAGEYADAVATYLSLGVSRSADYWSNICIWRSDAKNLGIGHVFARQAIQIVWDHAEANVLSDSSGNWSNNIDWTIKALEELQPNPAGLISQQSADNITLSVKGRLFSTDPPYYDNVPYADLSDFFYVWLRASLKNVYPELMGTLLVPKAAELVAEPFRHGGREAAQRFFEQGLLNVFGRIRQAQSADYPLTVYYAFKQAESEEDESGSAPGSAAVPAASEATTASTGWETMLEGLIQSSFVINGTWPMRTELGNRMRGQGSNALATSIVLVCRPRPEDARSTTRLEFIRALRRELPVALRALQRANIAPVDLAQAAIGPGMAIYSRYRAVLEADGTPMRVRTALQLINQALDEVLAEQEGEYDADTRWALAWFEQFQFEEGPYGVAETLSKAKNTSVAGMVAAGIVHARAGKVRLLRRGETPEGWNPSDDSRLAVWELAQHLVWALENGGEGAAAILLGNARGLGDAARDLAYRLYTTCERKKWAQEALAYNSLVIAWPEIARLVVERADDSAPTQARMEF